MSKEFIHLLARSTSKQTELQRIASLSHQRPQGTQADQQPDDSISHVSFYTLLYLSREDSTNRGKDKTIPLKLTDSKEILIIRAYPTCKSTEKESLLHRPKMLHRTSFICIIWLMANGDGDG